MALFIANHTFVGGEVQMSARDWRLIVQRLRTVPGGALIIPLIEQAVEQAAPGLPVRVPLTTAQIALIERIAA